MTRKLTSIDACTSLQSEVGLKPRFKQTTALQAFLQSHCIYPQLCETKLAIFDSEGRPTTNRILQLRHKETDALYIGSFKHVIEKRYSMKQHMNGEGGMWLHRTRELANQNARSGCAKTAAATFVADRLAQDSPV